MQNDAVAAQRELISYGGDTGCRRPGCAGGEPFGWNKTGRMGQLLRCADAVEGSPYARNHRVGQEAPEHFRVPSIRADKKVPVALKVGTQPPYRLLQTSVLRQVIADGGEARPDLDVVWVTSGALGGALDCVDAACGRFISEIGVQHDVVEKPSTQIERLGAKGQAKPERGGAPAFGGDFRGDP